jgi:hypothetical protein
VQTPFPVIDSEHDRGEFSAMTRERAWLFYERFLTQMIAAHTASLVEKEDAELRGRIKGLRDALAAPKRILDDAKANIAKKGDV